jgi:gluconolactonase
MQRRGFLAAAAGSAAFAQQRDWSGNTPLHYPDHDLVALDPRFNKYIVTHTPIQRLHTGMLWAEGPAWNGVGKYLVWSDIPNNVQMRWIEDDKRVTVFRNPSGYSNGNTFDFEGRQLSCEHGGRRVVRYEPNGRTTVIADSWQGKPLNSPNDIVVHPDGSIWFTDPTYGINSDYEGYKADKQIKEAVYRVESGKMTMITDEMSGPNGICFSPDYKKVYIVDTGAGRDVRIYDLNGAKLANGKRFVQLDDPANPKTPSYADGIRCDTDGNLWCGTPQGVQVVTPNGERIGIIQLPETCANISFGGAKRNRLFMAASQSLYALYVNATGAHIC